MRLLNLKPELNQTFSKNSKLSVQLFGMKNEWTEKTSESRFVIELWTEIMIAELWGFFSPPPSVSLWSQGRYFLRNSLKETLDPRMSAKLSYCWRQLKFFNSTAEMCYVSNLYFIVWYPWGGIFVSATIYPRIKVFLKNSCLQCFDF